MTAPVSAGFMINARGIIGFMANKAPQMAGSGWTVALKSVILKV
jgi:hypothetical protein